MPLDKMRHVGKIANTDMRCVVAYMQLPSPAEDFALVIPTDNLPPRTEQAVMDRLNTPEAQQTENFADVLLRHLMPDTGETILEHLHNNKKLVKVPVHNVIMLPLPNMPVKLSYILENWPGGSRLKGSQQYVDNSWETEKFNPHLNNQKAETTENARAVARGLLMEADDLENIARSKREQAYAKDPTLRSGQPQQMPMQSIKPMKRVSDYFKSEAAQHVPVEAIQDYWSHGMTGEAKAETPVVPSNFKDTSEVDARLNTLEKSLGQIMEAVLRLSPAQASEVAATESPVVPAAVV